MPSPDEKPPTDEAGNPSWLRWTWRRGLSAFILILVLTVGALLFDPPLQPLDDPQAGAAREIAAADNGWLFLAEKWSYRNLPKVPRPEEGHLAAFLKAKTAWDENDPMLAQAAQRGRDRLQELREALAYPAFQAPPLRGYSGGRSRFDLRDRGEIRFALLELLHQRQTGQAMNVLVFLDQSVRRIFSEGISLDQFWTARLLASLVMQIIPEFLQAPSTDSEWMTKLEGICGTPWFGPETFPRCLQSEVVFWRDYLIHTPDRDFADNEWLRPYPWWMWKFAFKPRQSANDLADGLRQAKSGWQGKHISSGGRFQKFAKGQGGDFELKVLLNIPGCFLSYNLLNSWANADYGARHCLFDQQAMLVRIALQRWENANGGLPAILKELIPAYLIEVPLDPFHGRPLQWDPHSGGVIYSEDGPDFYSGPSFGIVLFMEERPELRLKP